jgi:hypothetical protein
VKNKFWLLATGCFSLIFDLVPLHSAFENQGWISSGRLPEAKSRRAAFCFLISTLSQASNPKEIPSIIYKKTDSLGYVWIYLYNFDKLLLFKGL